MNRKDVKNYAIVILSASLGITTAAISAVSHAFTSMLTLVLDQATHQLKEEESMLSMDDLSKMSPYKLFMFIIDIVRPSKSVEDIRSDTTRSSPVTDEELEALLDEAIDELDKDLDEFVDECVEEARNIMSEELSNTGKEGNSAVEGVDKAVSSEELGVDNAQQSPPEVNNTPTKGK